MRSKLFPEMILTLTDEKESSIEFIRCKAKQDFTRNFLNNEILILFSKCFTESRNKEIKVSLKCKSLKAGKLS